MTPERATALLAATNMAVLPKEYAAEYCNLSEHTLERLANANKIDCVKRNNRLFFLRSALDDYMQGNKALLGKRVVEDNDLHPHTVALPERAAKRQRKGYGFKEF